MKKSFYFSLLVFAFPIISQAQGFSGEATYFSATTVDFEMDSTRMSVEQYEKIKKRMASALQKEYTLSFNKTSSLFKEIEKLEEEGSGRFKGAMAMMSGTGGLVYKNIAESQLSEQIEFFGKQFLIKDSIEDFEWKLGKETKMVGSYTCYKATARRKVVNRTMRGPDKGGSTVDTSFVDVTAWYTPQIPISQGPDIYCGLPGFIMEVRFSNTVVLCNKIILNKDKELKIEEPHKGDVVTREEYTDIILKKMEEMEATYGGREGRQSQGGGPGGGRGKRPSFTIQISR